MKNKIVIWGANAAGEKLLIALELKTDASKIMLYTFSEELATEAFVSKMMNDWREGKAVEFPEGHTATERELSVTESLLPDDLMVTERGDVLQRAQTEWHFMVLSAKLHEAYQQELAEFKEKIEQLSTYDNKLWEGLRAFWDKVQGQARDRNLFRKHADNLRDNINVLFEDLKKIRTKVQSEFNSASATVADEFNKALDEIDERIVAGGARLNSAFDELKKLQQRYKGARMSNEHRNQIWDRIDGAFKKAKERKFGATANEGSAAERHDRRLVGLADALKRIEESIARDEEELTFQKKKINNSDGQLEAQIRMAKIKMIEERVNSKKVKVDDIKSSMAEIERQAEQAKSKEAKRAEKAAELQRIAEAKENLKSEIAAEIKSKSGAPAEDKKEDSLFEAAATVLGDVLMDALDTAKAVASVVADKAEEAFEKASDKSDDALDKAKSVAGNMVDKAGDAIEKAMDKAEDAIELAAAKGEGSLGKAKAVANVVMEEAKSAFDKAMDKAEEALESFNAKSAPVATEEAKAADGIIIEDIVHKAAEGLESTADTAQADGIIIEDIVHKSASTEESADTASSEQAEKPKKAAKKKDA